MSLIHSEHKVIDAGDILSLSFGHGNNAHAIIVINNDLVAAPLANRVAVRIDPKATHAHVELDNKGHYTCYFPSVEAYNEIVKF